MPQPPNKPFIKLPEVKKLEAESGPSGLPKPKTPVQEENPGLAEAKTAVENFDVQRRTLAEMREDWGNNFPEANQEWQNILRQEDIVKDAMAIAKVLVAKSKKTIGDFIATQKFSKAHYDAKETTRILASLENRLEIFDEMLENGAITSLELNREAALAWFAKRPLYSKVFQSAFKDQEEMTCSVSVPKL